MIPAKKTLAAVDAQIEATAEEPFRRHLGASVMGEACARKIWYGWRWVLAEKFKARMLRLFGRGHSEEPKVIAYLRAIGVKLWEIDPDTGNQWRINGHSGHFGGSTDGVGKGIPDLPEGTPFLFECKTHNAKSFKKLQTDGIMKTKWKHFVQMQLYMGKLGLAWALYCAINKDDDDIIMELVQFDEKEFKRADERAGRIIWADEPPLRVSNSPAHFECTYCHLRRLCHFGDVTPAFNCRTCRFSKPVTQEMVDNGFAPGNWYCSNHQIELTEEMQRAGCQGHEVHGSLMGTQP